MECSSGQPRLHAVNAPKNPAAILWDMDGTLIDSEPYWIEAEMAVAAQFGVDWTHADGLTLVGNPLDVSAQVLIQRGIPLTEAEVIDALVTAVAARVAVSMPWLADAKALLDEVTAAGIPCALVTMSVGALVDRFLERAGDVFAVVVTGDQVVRGKPDPEAYLLAASRLGVSARECVAIEDSVVGIASAHASGAVTIGVPRHTGDPGILGVTLMTSLEGVRLADLAGVWTAKAAER